MSDPFRTLCIKGSILNDTPTNLLTIIWHVPSSKAGLQLTSTVKQGCKYATKIRKITKKEQFVLLYYRLLPFEGVTVYTQVTLTLVRMDSPHKHSSSNYTSHGISKIGTCHNWITKSFSFGCFLHQYKPVWHHF